MNVKVSSGTYPKQKQTNLNIISMSICIVNVVTCSMNKLHANKIMLHVDIFYLACRGTEICHNIYWGLPLEYNNRHVLDVLFGWLMLAAIGRGRFPLFSWTTPTFGWPARHTAARSGCCGSGSDNSCCGEPGSRSAAKEMQN